MTHTSNLVYFHMVSTISFSGNFPWEDLVVLKRTMVVALPLSLDLPLSIILDGSASRNVQVIIRGLCIGGRVHGWAQSGFIFIILDFSPVLLSLGHVHFQSQFYHWYSLTA